MPNHNKQKGNRVERAVVQAVRDNNLNAVRAYASNGLSLGHSEETDVLIEGKYRVQVKSKKVFPKWLVAAEKDIDWVVFKENNKPMKIMLNFREFLNILRKCKKYRGLSDEE